jgi:hypothetical protein
MVRSQKQRGSGRSRCPITIENGACCGPSRCDHGKTANWPNQAPEHKLRLDSGRYHRSNYLIRGLHQISEAIRKTALFRGPTYSLERHAAAASPTSSLNCTHVVFLGAVFRPAWFSYGVQGAASQTGDMNQWKAGPAARQLL